MSAAVQPLYVATPLWHSAPLSAAAGAPVWLKMESFQPAGSFKSRGMGVACRDIAAQGARRVVCASGGNAGLAVAYAGRQLGLHTTIVAPQSTSARARELIVAEGAELLIHGASWDDSHAYALELARQQNAGYVHAFDDPRVWAGHATMIAEVAAQGFKPGMVILSVGGGGLLSGVMQGMQAAGWEDTPVLAAETEGAASFAASLQAGRLVTLEAITSLATTLGARTVTAQALEWAQRCPLIPWVVSDRAAVDACLRFADDHRVLVEPACGAALSAAYAPAPQTAGRGPLLVIVCGGAGVTRRLLEEWDRKAV
jgi:L-serine/L-threonine ammonia-lyase